MTGFVYCLIESGSLEGFQHLYLDLTPRFPKLDSQTLSFRGHQFMLNSRPFFAIKLRKQKLSCPKLTSDNAADFKYGHHIFSLVLFSYFSRLTNSLTEAGTLSWSKEKVHTFLKAWGKENNLKIKTQAASISGDYLWYLLPVELAFLFTPDHARSSLARLDQFELLEQLGQQLFDKLHSFAVSPRKHSHVAPVSPCIMKYPGFEKFGISRIKMRMSHCGRSAKSAIF